MGAQQLLTLKESLVLPAAWCRSWRERGGSCTEAVRLWICFKFSFLFIA